MRLMEIALIVKTPYNGAYRYCFLIASFTELGSRVLRSLFILINGFPPQKT